MEFNELENRGIMFCADMISEDDLRGFLNDAIINAEDVGKFGKLVESGFADAAGKTAYLATLFLLYNEYLGCDWDDIGDISAYSYPNIECRAAYSGKHAAKPLDFMESPYSAIRPKFVRDHIITLDMRHYDSLEAIEDQISALDNAISDDERKLIKGIFGGESVEPLFRMPNEGNTVMNHATAERTEYLHKLSLILNCRYSDQLIYDFVTAENRDLLESVFEKIRSGTIH